MSQKPQIRECTIEELYAVPAQIPQQPTKVIPITASKSKTSSQAHSTSQVSSITTPAPNVSGPVSLIVPLASEKSYLQKHALFITLGIVLVALGVGIYLYRKEKKEKKEKEEKEKEQKQ